MLFIFPFVLSENKMPRQLEYKYLINLTIHELGNIKILSDNFKHLPDKIIINDEVMASISNRYTILNNNTIVLLIWFEEITNCSSMFSNCNYISKIDLSNFDSSKVIDMSKMFYQCYNLEEINFNNFITSSVINMDSMFAYSSQIKSLNLLNFDTSKVKK